MDPLSRHRATEAPRPGMAHARSTSRPSSPAPGSPAPRGRLAATHKSAAAALSRSSSPLVSTPSSPLPSPSFGVGGTPSPSSSDLTPLPTLGHTLPTRPPLSRLSSRMSRMRSRSPPNPMAATASTRKKYTYAAIFLALSLVSFVVQTELSSVIQHDLGWDKSYCMMYFTHGSWVVLWPVQLLILRFQYRDVAWSTFWRRHVQLLRSTALMTQTQRLDVSRISAARGGNGDFFLHIIRTLAMITISLTVAGLAWYIAVDMTSPSDLTAIYNCNAFFAYAFSVPILKERLRLDKMTAVGIAIVGVVVVAYGDTDPSDALDARVAAAAARRFLGNIIIGIGSVLYGLYEVLYKRYACPPEGVSPYRGMLFATTVASSIGAFTLLVLWIPLPILHVTGIEPFRLPTGHTAWLVLVAVLSNAVFSGSFLILISLTSPVLSGVASLMTIFLVAIADWFLKQKVMSKAAVVGGMFIVVAFLMLCWSSYREMAEHEGAQPLDMTDSGTGSDVEAEEAEGDAAALLAGAR